MSIAETDPCLIFVPIEQASSPPSGLIKHIKDRWWSVHPTKGLIFYNPHKIRRKNDLGSPQCNPNHSVSEYLTKEMYPWAECLFIPSVFFQIFPEDYV